MARALLALAVAGLTINLTVPACAQEVQPHWIHAGWGGGGFFYSAAWHPTRANIAYLGGDVAGAYRSEDGGRSWQFANRGLASYGVFGLAVSPAAPDTVFAATEDGMCRSDDTALTWRLLPNTGPKGLRLTGEKGRSVRPVAVDPRDAKVVWAASPSGRVYRSADGGETWEQKWAKAAGPQDPPGTMKVSWGTATGDIYGGFWMPLTYPAALPVDQVKGLGLTYSSEGRRPRDGYVSLQTSDGYHYRSKNVRDLFANTEWTDTVLSAEDFGLDSDWAKKEAEKAATAPKQPDFSKVNRLDLSLVGELDTAKPVMRITRFYFQGPDGPAGVHDFSAAGPYSYANIAVKTGAAASSNDAGPIRSVAISPADSQRVIAAGSDSGLLVTSDGGATWRQPKVPQDASTVTFSPSQPNTVYAAFGPDGLWRSTDAGETWSSLSDKLPQGTEAIEVVVHPTQPNELGLIGAVGWNGTFAWSDDAGASWTVSKQLKTDLAADPTLPVEAAQSMPLSAVRNLALNPSAPEQLLIAANWRNALSQDGGRSWVESARGADISVIYDLYFLGTKTYACGMDVGTLVTGDSGANWTALWPKRWTKEISGHNWRLVAWNEGGADQIVATASPWDTTGNIILRSTDGGATVQIARDGLPDYVPHANTMWGVGYPRALAQDPKNPRLLYLGIDGDPADGNEGGGVFRSTDGGQTWSRTAGQPGSRRMFFGLAVDPTDNNRLWWAACGTNGGVWRSNDAGATWEHVFNREGWLFNIHVAADGTVYAPGKDLWRSRDHGANWERITNQAASGDQMIGVASDPANPQRLWYSSSTWDLNAQTGGIYETNDGGATWTEITGDIGYRKPLVLKYNPATKDLWAAGNGIWRLPR